MACHTLPPPITVGELIPELAPLRKDALRLHPRQGAPTASDSSMGGPLRWPADEAWPTCDEEHFTQYVDDPPEEDNLHRAAAPMVSVIQLYMKDAPGLDFPDGCDLLQVLWCPFCHGENFERSPLPRIYWRSAAEIHQVAPNPPASPDAPEGRSSQAGRSGTSAGSGRTAKAVAGPCIIC